MPGRSVRALVREPTYQKAKARKLIVSATSDALAARYRVLRHSQLLTTESW
jgi:hypothetical protein